ncbi:MAG: hypothetical protein IPK18_01935 [Sphingobacteriales bacterium]|nr:MAG: hypothetical protein IPK18_01935 [Sphingobacteriales bacterium]
MIYNTINFEKMSVEEICEYLQQKYYNHILSGFDILKKYIHTCNLHEKDNDDTHGIVRVLINKLQQDCNLLITNDTYILFPKIIDNNENIHQKTIDVFKKIHQNILLNLTKLKMLFNSYQQEPYWNTYTQLSMVEMKNLDENIRNSIYLKENVLWSKIKIIED